MESFINDGFVINISGESRGKLSDRIHHLISSNDGKHYICNPNSQDLYEITAIEEIASIQKSSIRRLNVHYKGDEITGIKALTVKANPISSGIISMIEIAVNNSMQEATPENE